jgi:hypothetical protein
MRVASSRTATVAMVLIGLAALAVAGRLVRTTPSAEHPATSAAVTIPPAATATTVDSVEVPDAVGQTLAQAKLVMRAVGLRGAADDRDPQVPGAAVVVQEPAAGNLVPADSVVWFRTRTDVQANGVVRRLRLEAGQTTATYLVVAPDLRVRLVRQPRERVAKVVQGLRLPSSVADGSKDRQASLVAGARVLEVPMV